MTDSKEHSLYDSVSFIDKKSKVPDDLLELYTDFVVDLACNDNHITSEFTTPKQWSDHVLELRKKHKCQPRKSQMSRLYEECLISGAIPDRNFNFEQFVQIRASRSLSGILVIAVLMAPYPTYTDKKTGKTKQQKFSCKHNCYYCPNEPGMPRSYLSSEPAVARANRNNFSAIDQFYARAHTLQKLGHKVDKIELLVLGGTFCQFPVEYQEEFIRDLFWSANTFYDGIENFEMKRGRRSLNEEIKIHEAATKCRIVGLTLETRPDTIKDFETIQRFRDYGATRLQIGVQHFDDGVLKYINRGCYHKDTIRAVRMLKNAGYKIDIHLMPNLPGSNAQKDKKMFAEALSSDLVQCDQWKVYPCQTVQFSLIKRWYESGKYVPYPFEELMEVLLGVMGAIHPWIRLNRIFRSLPKNTISAGITMSNFRQHMVQKMEERGLTCKDIRTREIGTHIRKKRDIDFSNNRIILRRRCYQSSGGDEIFISFESEDETILMGFCRLRLPPHYIKKEDRAAEGMGEDEWYKGKPLPSNDGTYGSEQEYEAMIETFPELYRAALIREVHVYGAKQEVKHVEEGFGQQENLGSTENAKTNNTSERNTVRVTQSLTGQSKGYGSRMVADAESIALSKDYKRVAVIAGVGTRMYYRLKLGYKTGESYMVKDLAETAVGTRGVGAVNALNLRDMIAQSTTVLYTCFALFMVVMLLPIPLVMAVCSAYILVLDYLHFYAIKYSDHNRSMLIMSKTGMVFITLAVASKWMSMLMPRWDQVPLVPQLLGFEENHCFCKSYWSASLLLYVAAFYMLKLLFFKKTIIITQNPMFGNDRGINAIPSAVGGILIGQCVACAICELMMINMTWSYCSADGVSSYDATKAFGCHDSFDSLDIWFALSAIAADVGMFASFCNKWYGMIYILMEEMALSLLLQFGLVCVEMLSCSMNALLHLTLMFKSNPGEFDSFQGSGSFCLDCCILATCLTMSSVDFQKHVAKFLGHKSAMSYFDKIDKMDYANSLIA